jgi:hypothetical protein
LSDHISIDFETFWSRKLKYTVKNSLPEHYCASHLFDAYMISASDGENDWAGHPSEFNWQCMEGKIIVSHNARFDRAVYEELVKRGLAPAIKYKAWVCSANMTAYLCNRRALQQAIEHLYNVRLEKTERDNSENKHWPQDFTADERSRMLTYARSDARWCWKLWNDFSSKWPEIEQRLSATTIEQGRYGVQIDTALLDTYLIQSHEMLRSAENQIPWIRDAEDEEWEEFNAKPTSTKCIAEQCRLSKIPACPVKSDDQEAYDEWEATYGPNHPWIYALGAWRSINKLYKTFVLVKERLRPDGTMPFGIKYFGAHTGRWSGEAKVNMLNMRKKPVICNEHGLLELNEKRIDAAMDLYKETGAWPEWVKYAIDFRHLIIARPGKKLIVSDLSQIEPRVLAWLCGNWKLLKLLQSGMSVYEAHARASMGWTGGNLKKENPSMYALAKARMLALGYQAGWEKFIVMSWDLARVDVTKDDPEFIETECPVTGEIKKESGYGTTSRRIVQEFRAQNPENKGMWDRLDGAFKQSVGSDFHMGLPNGRVMRYEKVRGDIRMDKNKKTGKPERRSVYTADVGGLRKIFYGGKLTENITQGVARDVFVEHVLALDEAGYRVLFTVYDEAITEVDIHVKSDDIERVMSKCPDWLPGCPIGAEAQEVPHYCK